MSHRSPRALLFWALAAVIAVVTALVVAGDLASLHRRAHALGPERDVVVATHALPLGRRVHDDDLAVRRVHRSQTPTGILATTRDAVGRVVVVPVLPGGFVAAANLTPRDRSGLDGVVPAGMRALRVVVTDSLRPGRGAVVDVLATADPRGVDGEATSARVAAASVQVLGTDARGTTGGGRAGAFGVTLLVDPDQAADLAAAQAAGVLTLALVPPEAAGSATRR
jgi:Flp pilus assembly protein CpaB